MKVFQTVGRFLGLRTIPRVIFLHVAHRLGVDVEIGFKSSESMQYRHRQAILDRLGMNRLGHGVAVGMSLTGVSRSVNTCMMLTLLALAQARGLTPAKYESEAEGLLSKASTASPK